MSYNPAVQSVIGEMQFGHSRAATAPVNEQETASSAVISESVNDLILEIMSEQPSSFVFEGELNGEPTSYVIEDEAEGFVDLGNGWCLIEDEDGNWETVNEQALWDTLKVLSEAEGDPQVQQQAQNMNKRPGLLKRAWNWIKKSLGNVKAKLSDVVPDMKIKRMARLQQKDPEKARRLMLKRLTKQHGAQKAEQMVDGALEGVKRYQDNKQAFYSAVKGVKSGRPAPEHMATLQGLNDQHDKYEQAVNSGEDPKTAMRSIIKQHGTAAQLLRGTAPQQGTQAPAQAPQAPAQPPAQAPQAPAQQTPEANPEAAPADGAQAGQPAAEEPPQEAPPATDQGPNQAQGGPNAQQRRAMSRAAAPSAGQQAMNQAGGASFTVSGEGQATTGQDANGQPIVTKVPIKMSVNGQGLGSMIQTLMAQNFITAKTDKGHQQITPTKVTIDGDGKKITIQNSKTSGKPGEQAGQTAQGNNVQGVQAARSTTPVQKLEDGQALDANAKDLWAQAKAQAPNNKIKAAEIYKQMRQRQQAAAAQA